MATQSGVVLPAVNQPFAVANDLKRPTPGPKHVLVRTVAVSINPIENFMQQTGLFIGAWPAVLGAEGCGIVTECGEGVSRLKVGDTVYGCTQLGKGDFATFQDSFLAHEDLVFKLGGSITPAQACTVGANLETAALSLLIGTGMTLPNPGAAAEAKDEWVIVLGGSGNVGQYGIQIARLCGYKVLATCSASKASALTGEGGAQATVDSRAPEDEQVSKMREITGGNFSRVFDASAYGYSVGIKALETASTSDKKWFTTVDDWSKHDTPPSITEYRTELGHLGQEGSDVTDHIRNLIPRLEYFLEQGSLRPLDYEPVEGTGWEALLGAITRFQSGKASKKLVVSVTPPDQQ